MTGEDLHVLLAGVAAECGGRSGALKQRLRMLVAARRLLIVTDWAVQAFRGGRLGVDEFGVAQQLWLAALEQPCSGLGFLAASHRVVPAITAGERWQCGAR